MRHRLCQVVLLIALLLLGLGCGKDRPTPKITSDNNEGERTVKVPPPTQNEGKGKVQGSILDTEGSLSGGSWGDEVLPSLPSLTPDQLYEQHLLEAVDHLAQKNYKEALASLEKARLQKDTGAVQREIYKVSAILERETAAEKAVQDVKAILEDGKAEEAATLASTALSQYGGGDQAEELAKLKQEADAVLSASSTDTTSRHRTLRLEAETALKNKNLRTAAIALEQALALREDATLAKQLDEVREQLAIYDDCRSRAAALRKDPTQVEEALTLLRRASKVWPTLQVQQEIDECELVLERRRDRLSVADLEVLGEFGMANAGRILAESLMPHFRPRFDLVERSQINRILGELNLDASELGDSLEGRQQLHRLARVRYLVVGSLSPLAGVTLQARLVEVPTGLIVQTARLSAPDLPSLEKKLKLVAQMLQMNEEQKLAFEEALQQKVATVQPIEAAPLTELPPPPSPPTSRTPPPPPIVTYTPRPPALGGLVIEDFRRLPVVVAAPPPPPAALGVVLTNNDPRRHRLLRLSLELGDNCFRRGQFHEAQRHFALALSIGGPRREIGLRLDACRGFLPPPPPPPVVVVPPVPPVVVVPTPVVRPPAPPVVVVKPAVPVLRPRVAVFGFVINCRPGLVPPAASELFADQFASYCRGSYEILDRGEVCWYMGRLGLTMREVLNDPISRRCLAQALNARYFVFGAVQETASFNVETHLLDPETGARTGTGKIHVKDQAELKLRMGELAQQIGARPEEQQALAKKAAASEKALNEARALLTKDPARAGQVARAALKDNPESTALRALAEDAERRARLAALEKERSERALAEARMLAEAKKRQQELARQAAAAKAKAEAEAAARNEAQRKQQLAQKARAADSLRAQARQAQARGQYAQAVQFLQSAATLQPSEAIDRELAQVKVEAAKAANQKALAEQKQREEKLRAEREAAAKKIQSEKLAREKTERDRLKLEEARAQQMHDSFLKQAQEQMSKEKFALALSAAESAQRYKASPESAKLISEARDRLALANAKDAKEKARLEQERKTREAAERKAQQDREAYSVALKKAQQALLAKNYDEAIRHYTDAEKLFKSDAVVTGLKTATDLRDQQRRQLEAEKAAQAAAAKRDTELKTLLDQGKKLRDAGKHAEALQVYQKAAQLAPTNVDALAGVNASKRDLDAERVRLAREKQRQERLQTLAGHLRTGRLALSKGQRPEAEKAFRAALALDPENAEAKKLLSEALQKPTTPLPSAAYTDWMKKASAAMTAKRYFEAEKAYEEALKAKPGDAEALKGKREALALAKKPVSPPETPQQKAYQAALQRARTLAKSGNHLEALKAFDEALKHHPGDAVATREKGEALKARDSAFSSWMTKGEEATKAKRYSEGEKAYDEALKLKPGDPEAVRKKREVIALAKKPPTPPEDPKLKAYQAALTRARTLMKDKNYPEAVKAFDEALKHKPGDLVAIKERKDALTQIPSKPPAKDPKQKQREEDYQLAFSAGQAALKNKNYQGAVNSFNEALRLKPGDPQATRQKAEAMKLLTQAEYDTWMSRGNQALKAKKYPDALKAFDEALKRKPGDAAAIKGKKEASSASKSQKP